MRFLYTVPLWGNEVGFTNMGCLFPTGLATLSPASTKRVQTAETGRVKEIDTTVRTVQLQELGERC